MRCVSSLSDGRTRHQSCCAEQVRRVTRAGCTRRALEFAGRLLAPLVATYAAVLAHAAQACIGKFAHSNPPSLSPAALEALATLAQGCECLTDADLAAGVTQLLGAAGYTLEKAQGQSIASELR